MNLTEWFSRDPVGASILIGIIAFIAFLLLVRLTLYLLFDE